MNRFIIIGRFTRDPEITYTKDNKAVARGSVAVQRRYKQEGQPDADFFNYVAFGATATFIEKYFRQGMKAGIDGEMRNNNWTGKDGVKHYDNVIVIDNIDFCESKNTTNNDTGKDTGFINIPEGIDEELPFM